MVANYYLQLLQQMELFNGLGSKELKEIGKLCTEKFYKRGELCISEGDKVDSISFVKRGTVAVEIRVPESLQQDNIIVEKLGDGKLFAWSALLTSTLTASVRAIEDTEVLHINANSLLSLCENKPHMGYTIMKNLTSTVHSRLVNSRRELAATYKEISEYHRSELEESHEQLIQAEKLTTLGQLAASIAHEVNNPITGVLIYIQLMQKKMTADTLSKEQSLDYLSRIKTELTRSGHLVRNLLDFARQTKPNLKLVNLNEVIDQTLSMVTHSAELQHVKVLKELSSDLPEVIADLNQLQQVFTNLMLNAIQAMPEGGIMTLRTSVESGDVVKIEVQDTGTGITEENMQKLFTPFFTTKGETKGVGLGLTVCRGIIRRHNGKIEVQSKKGEGSTFSVYLPLSH